MKLSAAQQAVVDKMRDGWILRAAYGPWGGISLRSPDNTESAKVGWNTFEALKTRGILKDSGKSRLLATTYRLTKEWRNSNG